jgi:hypothetical protein
MGSITQATASLAVGYSICYITANNMNGRLIDSTDTSGISLGVGLGAFAFVGTWRSYTLAQKSINASIRSLSSVYK